MSDKIEPIEKIPSQVDVGAEDRNRESKNPNEFRIKLMKEMEERKKRLAKIKKDGIDKKV